MPQHFSPLLSFSLIFVIIIAVIAGFLGGLMSIGYLPKADYSLTRKFVIDKSQKSPAKSIDVSYEENKNLSRSILGIYSLKKASKGSLSFDNFYNYSEAIAQGLVLTSDGWVISFFDNFQKNKKYVAISQEGRIFSLRIF